MEAWIPTHLSPDMPLVRPVVVQAIRPGWRSGHPLVQVQRCPLVRPVLYRGQTRMEEWIPTHLSPDMPLVRPVVVQAIRPGWRSGHPLILVQRCPLVRPVLGRGQTRMKEWIPTHLSPDMPLVRPVLGRGQTRMEEWIPTHLSPSMPPGPTSAGQGSDQDEGMDTHSSESRHAPGPTSSGASYRTRMEEWTPTHPSPKMPPGLTSPGQGSDQDGGVDTHTSESRHAPGLTSSGASYRTRMEEWTPTCPSPKMPPGPTSAGQGSDQDGGVDTHSSESRHAPGPTGSGASHQTRMEAWTPTHLSPKMPP